MIHEQRTVNRRRKLFDHSNLNVSQVERMLPLAGKKFDCIWSSLQALSTVLVSVVVLVPGRWSLPIRDAFTMKTTWTKNLRCSFAIVISSQLKVKLL